MLVKFILNEAELKRTLAESLFGDYDPEKHHVRFIVDPLADAHDRPTGGFAVSCEVNTTEAED